MKFDIEHDGIAADADGLIDLDQVMQVAAEADKWVPAKTPEAFLRSPEFVAIGSATGHTAANTKTRRVPASIALTYAGWVGGIELFALVSQLLERDAQRRIAVAGIHVYDLAAKLSKANGARRHLCAMEEVTRRLGGSAARQVEERHASNGGGRLAKLSGLLKAAGKDGMSHSEALRALHITATEFGILINTAIKAQLIERFVVGRGIYYRTKTQPCT